MFETYNILSCLYVGMYNVYTETVSNERNTYTSNNSLWILNWSQTEKLVLPFR